MIAPSPHPHFFFFNDPAPTEIYTLPLHDALPISTDSSPPADVTPSPRASAATCTAPSRRARREGAVHVAADARGDGVTSAGGLESVEIGRASCRGRV